MSELLDDIKARMRKPHLYIPAEKLPPSTSDDGPDFAMMAVAVQQLFESAEPVDDSQLKLIDLPGELQAAARALRADAESAVDCMDQKTANRLGFLANVVEQVGIEIIPAPARVLQILQRDRDRWQQQHAQEMEDHAITMLALQQSQESNVALAHGQSELIGLLERVSTAVDDSNTAPIIERLYTEWMTTPDVPGDQQMVKLIREALGTVISEIHAKLNQVTAIETNAEGRLVVADPQPTGDAQ